MQDTTAINRMAKLLAAAGPLWGKPRVAKKVFVEMPNCGEATSGEATSGATALDRILRDPEVLKLARTATQALREVRGDAESVRGMRQEGRESPDDDPS